MSIAEIFKEAITQGAIRAPASDWKIINDILGCRTAAMGGHLYRCEQCSQSIPIYNSCRNRHCPLCQREARARWVEARKDELLAAPYFHSVFTLPHDLNGVLLQNKTLLFNTFFRSVTKAFHDVATRRFGATLGFLSVLHSWGQKMDFHPHLHIIVPGVIFKKDGSVSTTSENYLLPKRVLSVVFRAIFIKALVRCYKKGMLSFFGDQLPLKDPATFFALIKKVKSKEWLVYAKKPFSGPETALKYLARYTHRVAISESRILSHKNGSVTIAYKDYADGYKIKSLTLSVAEFTRRFLLHSLPHEFVRIRYAGFLAPAKRKKALAILKAALPVSSSKIDPTVLPKRCCPHCGAANLVLTLELPPLRFSSNSHKSKTLSLVV